MKWNKSLIAQWHRQTFVGCKAEQQRKKLHLECREFFDALKHGTYDAKLEELADVYISAASLYLRFSDYSAWFILRQIEQKKKWPEIADAVDAKMDVNATRRFACIDGEWRHVEG
jgi:NTP pyrophosphatase (non-canonical NTP hydrolase)